tara:strand:+ start:3386 stop:4105 length:720 start_codon:yes stop_codon:yes gene_type:complete
MHHYLDHKMEHDSLFQTRFEDGGQVVWRPLLWPEYRKFREARAAMGPTIDVQIEQAVYARVVVYSSYDVPPSESLSLEEAADWIDACRGDQPAGIIPTVVKTVMYMSGALKGPSIIKQINSHRSKISNIEDQLVCIVCKAFPAYTPEQVESLNWQTLLKRVAQAEQILGMDPIKLIDKEAEHADMVAKSKFDVQKEISRATSTSPMSDKEFAKEAFKARQEREESMSRLREEYHKRGAR